MKKIILSLWAIIMCMNGFSQGPLIQWQKTIGADSSDFLISIKQTFDGGYILGGITPSGISGDKTENNVDTSLLSQDYWIVKTNSIGNIQWQKTIGGSNQDAFYSIQQTEDSGYIIGGFSGSNISGVKTENSMGGGDIWILKTDALGNIQWQNTIGGGYNDYLYSSIRQTNDGGYIIGGSSASDISGDKTEVSRGGTDYWIVKIDAIGNIQWQNTIGGDEGDWLHSIQQTYDGGYILGGTSLSNYSGDKTENSIGENDYWIVKTDASGNIEWQNTIGGDARDQVSSIRQTVDGGYILGGSSYSDISGDKTENSIGWDDYWIVKIDASGNIEWQNTIGGNSSDVLTSILQTVDQGYVLAGYSSSNISSDKTEDCLGVSDFWILKTDSLGNIQWQNTIGGGSFDGIYSTERTADGGYILGGNSASNISGDKSESSRGEVDYWIVKLAPDSTVGIVEGGRQKSEVIISPNPFENQLTIQTHGNAELRIYDVYGRIILQKKFSTHCELQTADYINGIYFAEVETDKGNVIKKIVKH